MNTETDLHAILTRIEERLVGVEAKLDQLSHARRKSLEWIGQLSEHVDSLDAFREEVRATVEPIFSKLENLDDSLCVLRHATSDVSRRIEQLSHDHRRAG